MQQDRTDKHAELVEVVVRETLHNRGGRELEASVGGGDRNSVVGAVVDYKQTLRCNKKWALRKPQV